MKPTSTDITFENSETTAGRTAVGVPPPAAGSSCIARTLDQIAIAQQVVADLCKPRGTADAREWIMSIPARPDHDPDIIISRALRMAKQEIELLTKQLKSCQEHINELEDQWVGDNV